MQTLDQYNHSRLDFYTNADKPRSNGIACPSCGDELFDSNPSVVLTTWPAKFSVHCNTCDYSGFRIA